MWAAREPATSPPLVHVYETVQMAKGVMVWHQGLLCLDR